MKACENFRPCPASVARYRGQDYKEEKVSYERSIEALAEDAGV